MAKKMVEPWHLTTRPSNVYFSYPPLEFNNPEMEKYFQRVVSGMAILDNCIGQYYRLRLDTLCFSPKVGDQVNESSDGSAFVRTEEHARMLAIENAMDGFSCASVSQVAYAAQPINEPLDWRPNNIAPYLSADLVRSPGCIELELFQRLYYLSTWGVGDDGKRETRVLLGLDPCDSTRKLSFTFEIQGKELAPSWKPMINGVLIYFGPNPYDAAELEEWEKSGKDKHQHTWPKLWSVHT